MTGGGVLDDDGGSWEGLKSHTQLPDSYVGYTSGAVWGSQASGAGRLQGPS